MNIIVKNDRWNRAWRSLKCKGAEQMSKGNNQCNMWVVYSGWNCPLNLLHTVTCIYPFMSYRHLSFYSHPCQMWVMVSGGFERLREIFNIMPCLFIYVTPPKWPNLMLMKVHRTSLSHPKINTSPQNKCILQNPKGICPIWDFLNNLDPRPDPRKNEDPRLDT